MRLFEAGVIVFAAVDAGEGDRSRGDLPGGVGVDAPAGAVGKIEEQLRDQLRRAHGGEEVGVSAGGDVEHAVAEHDADGVGAGLEKRGHVVGDVQAGLAIVGPAGLEEIVADDLAVDMEFELAESAEIDHGSFWRALERELLAEQGKRGALNAGNTPGFFVVIRELLGWGPGGFRGVVRLNGCVPGIVRWDDFRGMRADVVNDRADNPAVGAVFIGKDRNDVDAGGRHGQIERVPHCAGHPRPRFVARRRTRWPSPWRPGRAKDAAAGRSRRSGRSFGKRRCGSLM